MVRVSRTVLSSAAAATLLAAGCAATPHDGPGVIEVTAGQSISAAVDKAAPGDLVLIAEGVYDESVLVDVPGVTVRGVDRDAVVIDGGVVRANGIVVTAPNVRIQNLTVRNATQNGILVTGMRDDAGQGVSGHSGYAESDAESQPLLDGFHIDHVTATANGLYGIYAFHSSHGVIESSYASGGADSGIYVGQCAPCGIVVRDNVAERNAVGFEIANAGGDLFVVGNRFVGNRVGATVASDYQEAFLPQGHATIIGNLIAANTERAAPEQADGGFGIGIGIAGGTDNVIARNRIEGHPTGMIVTSAEDLGPVGNRVIGNVFAANALDIAYTPSARAPGSGNCWSANALGTTAPADLTTTADCAAPTATLAAGEAPAVPAPAGIPFTDVAAPPAQPSLPDVRTVPAPWRAADVPRVDEAGASVPDRSLGEDRSLTRW